MNMECTVYRPAFRLAPPLGIVILFTTIFHSYQKERHLKENIAFIFCLFVWFSFLFLKIVIFLLGKHPETLEVWRVIDEQTYRFMGGWINN